MGKLYLPHTTVYITPNPSPDTKIENIMSPALLREEGLTFTVAISSAAPQPRSTLSPFIGLPIGSAHLGFDPGKDPADYRNFGLLIGRDVMANWSIFWNGPASSVMIND